MQTSYSPNKPGREGSGASVPKARGRRVGVTAGARGSADRSYAGRFGPDPARQGTAITKVTGH